MAGLIACALAVVASAPAYGATARISPVGILFYNASPGETNRVSISYLLERKAAIITDPGARIKTGNGCLPLGLSTVLCDPTLAAIAQRPHRIRLVLALYDIRAALEDGNDSLMSKGTAPISLVVDAGPGNDVVSTGGSQDSLRGDSGDDRLRGGAGPDVFHGGSGADDMSGGPGATGDARDHAYYDPIISDDESDVPRSVTLDDVADDGAAGEGDNIHSDIEGVTVFSSSPNTLTGNDGDNLLQGGRGPDVIRGMGGSDEIHGFRGNDQAEGGAGADHLDGGFDDDLVLARDGDADLVLDCDVGFDHLVADLIDPPSAGCEQDDRG